MVKKRGHQLSTIAMIMGGQQLPTINQNCIRTKNVNNYQQLSTIAMIMSGQRLSTIIQNCKRTRKVNHYQQLSTIAEGQERSTIINN